MTEENPNFYLETDHLTNIGFQAQPGDIYYMNPPKELTSYPMYISNPKKCDKTVGSYIAYTMDGSDITEQLTRRYSDFYSLYEKLIQRWPGIYVPRIPPKKITGNTDPAMIKTRMRLLNRFCLNLSNIEYLYRSEETNIFKNNIPDVASAINKLKELSYGEILARMKEAFPEYNENYDITAGKTKIDDFDAFLKKCEKNIEEFRDNVEQASEKREADKKSYIELMQGFYDYEKDNMMIYADKNENSLIFLNSTYSQIPPKISNLKTEMINPFLALRDWLQEEILDVEAMEIAIKQLHQLIESKEKLKAKLSELEDDLKKGQQGQVNFFKTIFKKKEEVIAQTERDKETTQQKIQDLDEIIKIVGDNMENQIEIFKNNKTQNYYKYLKIFAIMQRESNRVIRELWSLIKTALNDIMPNSGQEEEYPQQPEDNNDGYEQNNENTNEQPNEEQQQYQNEIHDNEEYQEQPPQEAPEGEGGEE